MLDAKDKELRDSAFPGLWDDPWAPGAPAPAPSTTLLPLVWAPGVVDGARTLIRCVELPDAAAEPPDEVGAVDDPDETPPAVPPLEVPPDEPDEEPEDDPDEVVAGAPSLAKSFSISACASWYSELGSGTNPAGRSDVSEPPVRVRTCVNIA